MRPAGLISFSLNGKDKPFFKKNPLQRTYFLDFHQKTSKYLKKIHKAD